MSDDTALPHYLQLEQQISALIETGALPAGTTLPPGRKLAQDLGLSRTTVQKCYDTLRRNKLLSAHGRLGFTVVAGDRVEPSMERLKGFTEEMREIGRVPSSRIIERAVVTDRSIASVFRLPSTAPLLKLVRVRFGDETPMSREVAWYNLTAAPALAKSDLEGSVYALLRTCGAALTHCEQTIEAAQPDAEECATFGFTEPRPCLLIKRRSFDADNRLVEYVEGLFRGDAYAYKLNLTI
ncbi:GntR family transcriptional regulator [Hansschlegelia plantiphila]|uniref:GntR family transcriptional regulator n=1 Tax=Hansschlegelia plantiphila TaxID=374655 RepID=UPI0022F29033|nr:GntR family transcriptional regulator [Hansschlegelia plantiphila]